MKQAISAKSFMEFNVKEAPLLDMEDLSKEVFAVGKRLVEK
jgi:hypothetical protein